MIPTNGQLETLQMMVSTAARSDDDDMLWLQPETDAGSALCQVQVIVTGLTRYNKDFSHTLFETRGDYAGLGSKARVLRGHLDVAKRYDFLADLLEVIEILETTGAIVDGCYRDYAADPAYTHGLNPLGFEVWHAAMDQLSTDENYRLFEKIFNACSSARSQNG